MKKFFLVIAVLSIPLMVRAEKDIVKGEQKEYETEVRCPNGDWVTIRAKYCEPGSDFVCSYISCANYIPPAVNCGNPE